MKQKLNIKAFALASALICGIVYIICALFSWINPELLIKISNYLFHSIDLTQIKSTEITLLSTIIGLIITTIFAYIIGGLFAWMYNKLIKGDKK